MRFEFPRTRAAYACDPDRSRGRLCPEPPSPTRTEFQRDRDRIIHSTAFRRLKHKTQVFVYHEGDHYRTRLTHSIEVSQIARALARSLGLDEDLAEALALAHDLGHPPFGHTGERALDTCMSDYGGFDHNAQSLRVVTRIETRYAQFDGLNLTWEMLEGLVKHNGPLLGPLARHKPGSGGEVPEPIRAFDRMFPLDLATFASLEAQAAAIADDIAYDAHDTDDGLRAGLFSLDEMAASVRFVRQIADEVDARHPGIADFRRVHEIVRRLITRMIEDVLETTQAMLRDLDPGSPEAVRVVDEPIIAFSAPMAGHVAELKAFLFQRMYRHPKINRIMGEAETVVSDLFSSFFQDPALLPDDWQELVGEAREASRARRIADYIAGMTDRYALDEHRRIFDVTPELR